MIIVKNCQDLNNGPAITLENAKKHLPKTVTHYDTWWDDYMVWRYTDFLNKK